MHIPEGETLGGKRRAWQLEMLIVLCEGSAEEQSGCHLMRMCLGKELLSLSTTALGLEDYLHCCPPALSTALLGQRTRLSSSSSSTT